MLLFDFGKRFSKWNEQFRSAVIIAENNNESRYENYNYNAIRTWIDCDWRGMMVTLINKQTGEKKFTTVNATNAWVNRNKKRGVKIENKYWAKDLRCAQTLSVFL